MGNEHMAIFSHNIYNAPINDYATNNHNNDYDDKIHAEYDAYKTDLITLFGLANFT